MQAIDTEKTTTTSIVGIQSIDRIYEDIETLTTIEHTKQTIHQSNHRSQDALQMQSFPPLADEPYYQVPKRSNESFYEVPKSCPIPVYENVDMYYDNTSSSHKFGGHSSEHVPFQMDASKNTLEPPKEKPPPPPAESTDDEEVIEADPNSLDAMKRMNSTKRIKKEIRNKRSSFLGLEGVGDEESFLELTVAPPPDMAAFIQEERRIEKQMYIKAGLYDSSDTADSRDSGVSENHSRQSSEPLTTSSEEQDQEVGAYMQKGKAESLNPLERKSEMNGLGRDEMDSRCRAGGNYEWISNESFDKESDPILKHLDERERSRYIDDQMHENQEVLKVERELLQLEQEELKRQRGNMALRQGCDPSHIENNDHRHQDMNSSVNLYANVPNRYEFYQVETNYRKSMPNLQAMMMHETDEQMALPPIPPAKPLRAQEYLRNNNKLPSGIGSVDAVNSPSLSTPVHLSKSHHHSQSTEDFVPLRQTNPNGNGYGNMSRHTLHALSAVPRPKFQDGWVQQQRTYENGSEWRQNSNDYVNTDAFMVKTGSKSRLSDSRAGLQPLKRSSDPHGFNYNNHWLIQEAEQRRMDQQRSSRTNVTNIIQRRGSSDNKPLPEAVIQTLTQRVQNRLGDRKRYVNLFLYNIH